jgi:pyrimidine-nucleoside phosphorylase
MGKISGRGLGFTGGTLDKLESIPGYRTDLSEEEFKTQLAAIGMVLTGQTGSLAPADKKLYALRDVTATVSSIPLIVSSILSKKIASGADALVLDVKAGDGALMKNVAEARILAHQLVRLGNEVGIETVALVSDMNQPLGEAVGNALEVREAISTLHGGGPDDLRQHCLTVVAELLALAGSQQTLADGQRLAQERLDDGSGWEAFRTLVAAQDGDVSAIDDPDRLPSARLVETVEAPTSGTLAAVDADEVGLTVMALGGGREEKGDAIDHAVGVVSQVQIGDDLDAGAPLVTIHANDERRLARARRCLLAAYTISQEPVEPRPLFHDRIRA